MEQKKRGKFWLIALGMSVFIGLLLSFGTYFVTLAKQDLNSEKVLYLFEVSSKNAMLIKTKVDDLISQLEATALFIEQKNTFDINTTLELLSKESQRNEFKRMGIITLDGRALTTDGYTMDFSDRDYFKAALQGKSSVSDRLVDKVDNVSISVFATPLYHQEKIVAVLFATKNTLAMAELLDVSSFNGAGYSYIVKADGSPVIYSLNQNSLGAFDNLFDKIGENPQNNENLTLFKEDIRNGRNGVQSFYRDGAERQVSYTKIGINDWYMVSGVASSAISERSDSLLNRLVTAMLSVLLLIVALAIVIIRSYQKHNRKLHAIAFSDDVTGYCNWNRFALDCEALLTKQPDSLYAMVAFDIDKFKVFNDTYGHEIGDKLLKHVASIAYSNLGGDEYFARVSADNFCMLLQHENNNATELRIRQISSQIKQATKGYHIETVFGIYTIDDVTLSVSALYDRATIAKHTIKNRLDLSPAFYDEPLRNNMLREKEIENSMEDSLLSGEFVVYLQPKYLLISGEIVSAEALVRWNRPGIGLIPPNDFIPLFEKNGFIKKLDLYMFEQVCILLSKWNSEQHSHPPISVSVNLSRIHLSNTQLPSELFAIAKRYRVDTGRIEIELTESAMFGDAPKLIAIMTEFKKAGFSLSIDDFGSGYSSLNSLKDLPVDIIKLDRGFLQETTDDTRGKVIVSSLIEMTKELSLCTVAEGVETLEQIDFLKKAGCDIAQGFYYARPMPICDFEALMNAASPPAQPAP